MMIYCSIWSIIYIITHHGNDKDPHGIGDDDDSYVGDDRDDHDDDE